jgi:hypothetical protein
MYTFGSLLVRQSFEGRVEGRADLGVREVVGGGRGGRRSTSNGAIFLRALMHLCFAIAKNQVRKEPRRASKLASATKAETKTS